jgi:deoxycytidylate deaminase
MVSLAERLLELEDAADLTVLCHRKVAVTVVLDQEGTPYQNFSNGPLNDDPDRCTDIVGGCGCIHSEFKAIVWCLNERDQLPKDGKFNLAVLYSPCTPCANLIVTSGIIKIVHFLYDTDHDMRGINILHAGGVEVRKLA